MFDWLTTLTQPQATLGSAVITFAAAVTGVLLAWKLFSAKVRDMRSALTATEELLKAHQTNVQFTLADIEQKISGLAASTAQLRADVSDNQAVEMPDQFDDPAEPHQAIEAVDVVQENEGGDFDSLSAKWIQIRDHLEDIASDSSIDGRTAAKYARIDRRSYADLVAALNKDGKLASNGDKFLEAAQIWASHRTRKRQPTSQIVQRMNDLALLLATPE